MMPGPVVDNDTPPAELTPAASVGSAPGSDSITTVTYTYRQDHVDRTMRYRRKWAERKRRGTR